MSFTLWSFFKIWIKGVAAKGLKVLHAILSWQERRKLQHIQMLQKQKETTEKIAAWAFAKRYLTDLIPSVFSNLRESGFFYDPIERGLSFFLLLLCEVSNMKVKTALEYSLLSYYLE